MTNTKKQHYVWREYLRKFCYKNDQIFSLINMTKIVPNNLSNVGQENFFHKAQDFDKHEIVFLENFINDYLKNMDEMREYFQALLDRLKLTLLKKQNNISQDLKDDFEKMIQNDFFESTLTNNENLGKYLINIKTLNDLKKCFSEKNIFKTNLYLSIQLIRTKRQKKIFFTNFNIENIAPEKVWLFLGLVIGNVLAYNLTLNSKYELIFLRNVSNLKFITSDQPVINLKENERDENGTTKHFSLYYPLSPDIALLLDYDVNEISIKEKICDDTIYITHLNKLIAYSADIFVFAKSKELLEDFIKL